MLRLLLKTIFILCVSITFSQNVEELKNVDIDNLSDSQIQAYIKRAEDSGLTMQQLELLARQRGMSSSQVAKLRQRIWSLQSGA